MVEGPGKWHSLPSEFRRSLISVPLLVRGNTIVLIKDPVRHSWKMATEETLPGFFTAMIREVKNVGHIFE